MTSPSLFGSAAELNDWRTALEAILGVDLSDATLPAMIEAARARLTVLAPMRGDDIAAAMEGDMLDELLVMATGSSTGSQH